MLTVVTGAPCSGKTTYVRTCARPGDIIVDYDTIAQALGSQDGHDHGQAIREVAAAAWSAAIDTAIRQHQAGARVWVVDSRPNRFRSREYDRARALVMRCEADADELHRRADADGRPASTHARIDEFTAVNDPECAPVTKW